MNNNPTMLARLKDVLFCVDTLCMFRNFGGSQYEVIRLVVCGYGAC